MNWENTTLTQIAEAFNLTVEEIERELDKNHISVTDSLPLTDEDQNIVFEVVSRMSSMSDELLNNPIVEEALKQSNQRRYANRDVLLIKWRYEGFYVADFTKNKKIDSDYIIFTCQKRAEFYESYGEAFEKAQQKKRDITQFHPCQIVEYAYEPETDEEQENQCDILRMIL